MLSLTVDDETRGYDSKFIKLNHEKTSMNISNNDKDCYKKISSQLSPLLLVLSAFKMAWNVYNSNKVEYKQDEFDRESLHWILNETLASIHKDMLTLPPWNTQRDPKFLGINGNPQNFLPLDFKMRVFENKKFMQSVDSRANPDSLCGKSSK